MTHANAGDSHAAPLRVVKLGGSLLRLDDWAQRFAEWHAIESPARTILIVGGGKLADCVRDYDRRFALGEEASHWLCIRTLSLHAEMAEVLLRRVVSSVQLARRFEQLVKIDARSVAVFDPERFLRELEGNLPGECLPHNWDVTTDSIAARVAECLDADELVLLKSAVPTATDDGKYVDQNFAAASKYVRHVRFVDLSNDRGNNKEGVATGVLSTGGNAD